MNYLPLAGMLWQKNTPFGQRMARGNESRNSLIAACTNPCRSLKSRSTPALNASQTLKPAFMIPSPCT